MDTWGHKGKVTTSEAWREASGEASPADLQPPELWGNSTLSFRSSRRWCPRRTDILSTGKRRSLDEGPRGGWRISGQRRWGAGAPRSPSPPRAPAARPPPHRGATHEGPSSASRPLRVSEPAPTVDSAVSDKAFRRKSHRPSFVTGMVTELLSKFVPFYRLTFSYMWIKIPQIPMFLIITKSYKINFNDNTVHLGKIQ